MQTKEYFIEGYFTRKLKDIACIEGAKVRLTCEVIDDNMEGQWLKDGIEITNNEKYIFHTSGKHHKLTINTVDTRDSGDYMISVNGRTRSANIKVTGEQKYYS